MAGGDVVIPPESYVWPRVIRKFLAYKHLPWEEICSIVISEFEAHQDFHMWECNIAKAHEFARKTPPEQRCLPALFEAVYKAYALEIDREGKRWGDKTPINTIYADKIYRVYPKALYIHIIRDPRDVANSYVKAARKNRFMELTTVEKAASFWKASVGTVEKLKKRNKSIKIIEIKYEDLVSEPVRMLQDVSAFLNIPFKQEMLDFWKRTSELGDVKYYEHHANLSSPLNTGSIGKWKEELSERDCRQIKNIVGSLAGAYGYDLK